MSGVSLTKRNQECCSGFHVVDCWCLRERPKSYQTACLADSHGCKVLQGDFKLRTTILRAAFPTDIQAVNDDGNQYIVLLNIPKAVRVQLDEDKNVLDGVGFRFMFEGNVGVIKVVPSYIPNAITGRLSSSIDRLCIRTNVPESELE